MLWKPLLASPKLASNHVMVAVDLPGHGMSQSLPSYGPDQVLNAISEFILRVVDRHMLRDDKHKQTGKVVIVGHDWGALIASRLAIEAPLLADRFIVSNFPLVGAIAGTTHIQC
jgi:pimeloyl-ACP methyl ester carboxylesterase